VTITEEYDAKNHAKGQRYTIVLSCLHTLTFDDPAPKMGETLWCARCRDYKPAAIAPPNYRLTCDHGCKGKQLKHEFGAAIVSAEASAVKHSLRRTGHRVTLANGDNVLQVFFHPLIVVDVDEIPF
jgi:hypothetical protein